MKHRTNKKRMFLDETRVLITDKKGRALVCMGSFESAAPKTINSIESSCKPVNQNCAPTQLSLERLEEIRDCDTCVTLEESAEMARMLLARMDSEPVGEVVLGDYDDCGDYPDAKVVCIAAQGQADWNNFRNGTKLYAAPPAPVTLTVSKDEIRKIFIRNGFTIKDGQSDLKDYVYDAAFELISSLKLPAPVDVPDQIKFLQQQIKDLEEKIEAMELQSIADSARSDYEEGN